MVDVTFIGGFGRSGSTLIELMLAQFPGVTTLGEVVHLWERGVRRDERCGCGERFSRCPFWTEVGERAFGGWHCVDIDRVAELTQRVDRTRFVPQSWLARPGSHRSNDMLEYTGYFARVYSAAAHASGTSMIVDSSKHASTAYVLRADPQIALRVLHLVRDSRGVAYSWTKRMSRPEADESGEHALMHRYPPWQSALLWDGQNIALAALARLGTPVLRVYYEHLLADPATVIGTVADYLGLQRSAIAAFLIDSTISVGGNHQIAGNPMRFQHGVVKLRSDEAWRVDLPRDKRRLVSVLTAPVMLRYGYFGARKSRK